MWAFLVPRDNRKVSDRDIRLDRISQAQSIVLEVQTYTIETHIQMEPLHGLMRKLLEEAFLI